MDTIEEPHQNVRVGTDVETLWRMVVCWYAQDDALPSSRSAQAVKDLARRTGRREAALMREAIAEYIARQSRPWPRSIGMGHDAELSSDNIDAWLDANWQPE